MKSNSKQEKLLYIIGVLFVLLGIVLNKWALAYLLSEDGIIEYSNELKIWAFDILMILSGSLIIIRRKNITLPSIKINELLSISLNKRLDIFLLCVGAYVLVFTFLQALLSDLTYDEAYTYMHYVWQKPYGFFIIQNANNHPLNSFLIYLSSLLFPYNELAIRFPNLAFGILFILIAIEVAKKYKSGLILFGLLTLNYFLFPTYFSQARGYGISTSLVLVSLWTVINRDKFKNYVLVPVYILLFAAYAYFGVITLLIAVAIDISVFDIRKNWISFINHNYIGIIFIGINLGYILYTFTQVIAVPAAGSYEPFIHSVIGDYLQQFLHLSYQPKSIYLFIVAVSYLVLVGLLLFRYPEKLKFTRILLINFLLIYVSATIMQKPYPTGRLLLPYWPLLAISSVELLDIILSDILELSAFRIRITSVTFLILLMIKYLLVQETLVSIGPSYGLSQIRLRNNLNNYKTLFYDQFFIDIVEKDDSSTPIHFYMNKDKYYNILPRKLLQREYTCQSKSKDLQIYYFFTERVLLYEATEELDRNNKFFLHIFPKDNSKLAGNRKQYSFDNLDFSWEQNGYSYDSMKYYIRQLPEYGIEKIETGQFDEDTSLWEKKIEIPCN